MIPSLEQYSALELFKLHGTVLDELKNRKILRTNNIVGEYAEYLCCKTFNWECQKKSAKGIDAIAREDNITLFKKNDRFQIKARQLTSPKASKELGAFRSFEFEYLAAVLFDTNYQVIKAALIPIKYVNDKKKWKDTTKSWKIFLQDKVWQGSGVKDITEILQSAQSEKHL